MMIQEGYLLSFALPRLDFNLKLNRIMKRTVIEVPEGIKYISQWKDYVMPEGHCIVDKGVTGCGFTEMCLTNDLNVVLCSPRKMLLENKAEQHAEDKNIFYFKNDFKDVNDLENARDVVNELTMKSRFGKDPFKFMITYDSFHYVKDFLKDRGLLSKTYVIVDEMQSMFNDIFLKADVENNFLISLQDCPNVLYLSATPMMEDYLDKVNEFKDLPMYYLDWSKTGFVEPLNIQRLRVTSIYVAARDYIEDFRNGKYPILVKDGKVRESKEAVFFLNSVTDIVKIVNSCDLKPSEVNILCSDTVANRVKLRRIGHKIGKIPLKGQPNKMFTFCTSTVYVGADFYSTCASTYIFSDPNVKSLAVDIAIDFPQIVGRQRCEENCFKNYVTVIYKTLRKGKIITREEFEESQEKRRENTMKLLSIWNRTHDSGEQEVLLDKCRTTISVQAYEKDFISISEGNHPVYNPLIELAYERAWEVVQEDYQNVVNVTRALEDYSNGKMREIKTEEENLVNEFLEREFYSTGIFTKKMESFCRFMDSNKENKCVIDLILRKVEPKFNNYYSLFGTEGCHSSRFRENLLAIKLREYSLEENIRRKVIEVFEVGKRYSRKDAKGMLKNILDFFGLSRTPKATELEKWLDIKPAFIMLDDGKKDHGFEILGIKPLQNLISE